MSAKRYLGMELRHHDAHCALVDPLKNLVTTTFKVEWPKGTVAVNAVPWAEVWIDGDRIGETPIGNLSLPIGPHEIVFRHPELGELHHAVTVTLNTPARVSVDLRKKP